MKRKDTQWCGYEHHNDIFASSEHFSDYHHKEVVENMDGLFVREFCTANEVYRDTEFKKLK